jgi:hypothetical protein
VNVTLFDATVALPDRLLVGIVTNKAYAGQAEFNPFNFQHFDIQSIVLQVDGREYPNIPYTPDFGTSNDYISLYDSLLREYNADNENHMLNILPKEFANGYTLFPFRLVPRALSGDVLGEPITGPATLKVIFKTQPTETLTIIVLSEYRSEYEVRQVGEAGSEPKPQQ